MARNIKKRPKLDPTEHPRPQVMVPMRVFGEPLFNSDYARLGRFVHYWCHAVWKKDPAFHPFQEDGTEHIVEIALLTGFLERVRGRLWLTGPNKESGWLRDKRRAWQTYVIEAIGQDLIKIGKSTDIERRFDELQVASPHDLKLIVVWDGDLEAQLHRQFSHHRVGGEWFRYCDEVRDAIATMETR